MNYLTQYQSILANEFNPILLGGYTLKMDNMNATSVVTPPMLGVGFDNVYAQEGYSNSFRVDVVMELIRNPQATSIGLKDTTLSFETNQESQDLTVYSNIFRDNGLLTAMGLQNSTIRGRLGDDRITVQAGVFANSLANTLAVGVDNSFVTGNSGDDIIDIRAYGSSSLAARNSRILGGPGNDIISLTSNSKDGVAVRDSVIGGRTGDDDVLINGTVQYSQQFILGGGKMGRGIIGAEGFDTLRLPYLTKQQFLNEVTVYNGVASNEFSLASSANVNYYGWERLVCANNELVNLTQLVG